MRQGESPLNVITGIATQSKQERDKENHHSEGKEER